VARNGGYVTKSVNYERHSDHNEQPSGKIQCEPAADRRYANKAIRFRYADWNALDKKAPTMTAAINSY
jgi:hypothetical protein